MRSISCAGSSQCVVVGNSGTIWKYNGTAWSAAQSPVTTALNGVDLQGSLHSKNAYKTAVSAEAIIVGDSGTILGSTLEALPISLVSANAIVREQTATLTWATASETNNDRFIIEQQTAQGWKNVGEVRGAGTTAQAQSYTFPIPNLTYGNHIFRIAQINFDGTKTYGANISVWVELVEAFALSEAYPNPFNPSTNFTLAVGQTQNVQIRVFDLLGREVAMLHNGSLEGQATHTFSFNAQGLSSGKYLLRVQGENFAASKQVVLVK